MNFVNHETYSSNNISNFCDWMAINKTIDGNCNQINVTLKLKDTEYVINLSLLTLCIFHIKYIEIIFYFSLKTLMCSMYYPLTIMV